MVPEVPGYAPDQVEVLSAVSLRDSLGIVDGISAPGLTVDLRADMDVTVVVSNCPQINNPCNGFNPTPVRMIVAA